MISPKVMTFAIVISFSKMHISGKGKRKNKKVKGFSVTDNGFFILL
jgi:hypothetical protein